MISTTTTNTYSQLYCESEGESLSLSSLSPCKKKQTLIEKDHLGDWSPEKDCCW